jgi:hypothetical protein
MKVYIDTKPEDGDLDSARFIAIDVPVYLKESNPETLNYILGYLAGRNKALDAQNERYLDNTHEL